MSNINICKICEHYDPNDEDCEFYPNLERCPYGEYDKWKKDKKRNAIHKRKNK